MKSLAGVGVLIVRPRAQALDLCKKFAECGAHPLPFAALEIVPIDDPAALGPCIERLESFDLAIFTSANAVREGLPFILQRRSWPALTTLAIGPATALALIQANIPVTAIPEQTDSEGLLSLEQLSDLSGKKVLIVGGEGGRDALAQGLRERGATVEKLAVYRRVRGQQDPSLVNSLGQAGLIHFAIVTSSETLTYLLDALNESPWLFHTKLILLSDRTAKQAQQLGFTAVRVASKASDDALIATVIDWYAHFLET